MIVRLFRKYWFYNFLHSAYTQQLNLFIQLIQALKLLFYGVGRVKIAKANTSMRFNLLCKSSLFLVLGEIGSYLFSSYFSWWYFKNSLSILCFVLVIKRFWGLWGKSWCKETIFKSWSI